MISESLFQTDQCERWSSGCEVNLSRFPSQLGHWGLVIVAIAKSLTIDTYSRIHYDSDTQWQPCCTHSLISLVLWPHPWGFLAARHLHRSSTTGREGAEKSTSTCSSLASPIAHPFYPLPGMGSVLQTHPFWTPQNDGAPVEAFTGPMARLGLLLSLS